MLYGWCQQRRYKRAFTAQCFGAQKEFNEIKASNQSKLKPLNGYMWKRSFKMDHLKIVLSTPTPQFSGVSIDISDAFLHIPIRLSHRKFLRFSVADQILDFKALPFGLTTAPRVFTKVVSAIAQFMRINRVSILIYVDDWLLYSHHLAGIHPKSGKVRIPTQDFLFIGLLSSWTRV